MKKEKILFIISYCFLAIFLFCLFLSFCIPTLNMSVAQNGSTLKIYLFDLFSISLSSGSSSSISGSNAGLFYGFLFLSSGFISSIFLSSKNKTLYWVGFGLLLGFLAECIYLCCQIGDLIKSLGTHDILISKGGYVLLVISLVVGFIYVIFSLFINYFLSLLTIFIKPKQSLEERLNEINQLKEKGLISCDEAAKMREETLK